MAERQLAVKFTIQSNLAAQWWQDNTWNQRSCVSQTKRRDAYVPGCVCYEDNGHGIKNAGNFTVSRKGRKDSREQLQYHDNLVTNKCKGVFFRNLTHSPKP